MKERPLTMRLDRLMDMRERWKQEDAQANKDRITEITQKIDALQVELDRQNEETDMLYTKPLTSQNQPNNKARRNTKKC